MHNNNIGQCVLNTAMEELFTLYECNAKVSFIQYLIRAVSQSISTVRQSMYKYKLIDITIVKWRMNLYSSEFLQVID